MGSGGQALTQDRVRHYTATHVQAMIDRRQAERIRAYETMGEEAIRARIAELEREWDVERALMLNFAVVGGLTLHLGLTKHRGWLWFFRSQMAFLAQHAIFGWCPPLPVFRRLGFRTLHEIAAERAALERLLERSPEAHATH